MVTVKTDTCVVGLPNFQNPILIDTSFQSLFVLAILVLHLVLTQDPKKSRQPLVL